MTKNEIMHGMLQLISSPERLETDFTIMGGEEILRKRIAVQVKIQEIIDTPIIDHTIVACINSFFSKSKS